MSEMITDRPDGNTYYNYTDLNRVEAKAEELAALMTAEGYIVTVSVKKDWAQTDFPTASQMKRYLGNVKKLADNFYAQAGANLPRSMKFLDYRGANEIEKVLVTLEQMITVMKQNYRRCNTFNCGEG